MSELTDAGRDHIAALAGKHGLSVDAVRLMAQAVAAGGGTMAQFNIAELGGSGQWMAGGMTMVGNMFDHGLQGRVANLCEELADAMASTSFFKTPRAMRATAWWPPELGAPSAVGGQNQMRYAYFPSTRRIAFDPGNGQPVILLDTGEHQIGGFSQQQTGEGLAGITFSSQFGQFALSSLGRVGSADRPASKPEVRSDSPAAASAAKTEAAAVPNASPSDILTIIERLAALHDAGVLTDDEFATKKRELLARL